MASVFIPQTLFDGWDIEGKVSVTEGVMKLPGSGATFRLEPAVRFAKSVGRPGDPVGVLNTVRRHEELTEMGWEHYLGTVLIGEDAYEVDEGFYATYAPNGAGALGEEEIRGLLAELTL